MHTHRSFYADRKRIPTCAGSRFKPEYSARYDERGVLVLDEVGTVDVYADIQSYADSCEIHNLLRRYMAGETDVLNKVQGIYADASNLPDSYVGFLNRIEDAQSLFASLPPEVRSLYDNDFARFVADFDSRDIMRASGMAPEDDVAPVDEPKKTARKKSAKAVETVEKEEE